MGFPVEIESKGEMFENLPLLMSIEYQYLYDQSNNKMRAAAKQRTPRTAKEKKE